MCRLSTCFFSLLLFRLQLTLLLLLLLLPFQLLLRLLLLLLLLLLKQKLFLVRLLSHTLNEGGGSDTKQRQGPRSLLLLWRRWLSLLLCLLFVVRCR
jgi:hypothetical protein